MKFNNLKKIANLLFCLSFISPLAAALLMPGAFEPLFRAEGSNPTWVAQSLFMAVYNSPFVIVSFIFLRRSVTTSNDAPIYNKRNLVISIALSLASVIYMACWGLGIL
jgi:hypothetical protein